MQENARKILVSFGILFLIIFIGFLGYYRFLSYLKGPEIISINIKDYEITTTPWKKLKLEIKNTEKVEVNLKNIPIQENNNVNTIIVFHKNENIIKIKLTDHFNNKREYLYHIYLKKDIQKKLPKTLAQAKENKEEQEDKPLLKDKQK